MGKLVEHLMPCTVCWAVPKIKDTYDKDPEKGHCYKLFCSRNSTHNSAGNWFENKYKACQDWNKRQEIIEINKGVLSRKLKPCPFCGREMQFYCEQWIDKDENRRKSMYFMHEDYNLHDEESCILDDICMPFIIGAGDANPETEYIGEYATKWNSRYCNENPMHGIEQILSKTIKPLEQTVELLEQRNKMLEQENGEQKQIIKRTKQWRVNKDIKSLFANISGLCCVHCDHKDEYIIELEEENQKLKQMLKKVADDAEGLFMGFAGYNPYEKRLKHEDCEVREYCDYCDRDCDCDGQCKWRYEDDIKKLLGEVK